MLKFYYNCLTKYMEPHSFELTETDTDSINMGSNAELLAKNVLGLIIKPDMKKNFWILFG